MNTRIIDTADAVVRRYKTWNPEEIISQRAIKLKDIRFCHDLLGYYEFNADRLKMEKNLPSHCSSAYRAMKYQELLQEFLYMHSGVITPAEIAQSNTIEKHFVDFKLNILATKGYQLPVLPELHSDFLKDSMKNCEVTMD